MNRDDRRGLWVKWFPEHILSSSWVGRLSITEEGAFRRLLDYNYRDGSIPIDDEDELMYMVKIEDRVYFRGIWLKIQDRFPRMRNSKKGCNPRVRTEICWIHERSITNSNNAKRRHLNNLQPANAQHKEREKEKEESKSKSKRKNKKERGERVWFSSLSQAGQKRITALLNAFAQSRKRNAISDRKRDAIIDKLERADQDVLPKAVKIFMDQHVGKSETYFFGIVRRLKQEG